MPGGLSAPAGGKGTGQAGPLERASYRVGQFLASLRPRVTDEEQACLGAWLPPMAVELFRGMPLRDQRHSLDVYHALRDAGCDQADLLAAALLHDVGKSVHDGRPIRWWHRVLVVLMEAARPGLVDRLASDVRDSWRYPFYAQRHHPGQGAQLARQAGCSELTATLIAQHQDKLSGPPANETEALLAWLQAADDAN